MPSLSFIHHQNDDYCFICHKPFTPKTGRFGKQKRCQKCLLSIHSRHQTKPQWMGACCHECLLRDDTKHNGSRLPLSAGTLSKVLKVMTDYLSAVKCEDGLRVKDFIEMVDSSIEQFNLRQPFKLTQKISFDTLFQKITRHCYQFLEEFEYDLRLIEHNFMISCSNEKSIKRFKHVQSLIQIEIEYLLTCHHCYLKYWLSTDKYDGFMEPCPKRHVIVWSKKNNLKVWWPAKVMGRDTERSLYIIEFMCVHTKIAPHSVKQRPTNSTMLKFSKLQPRGNKALLMKNFPKEIMNEFIEAKQQAVNYCKRFKVELPLIALPFDHEISYK